MKEEYIDILQHIIISEQLRLSFKGFEDDDALYASDVNYSINDLERIYFELEDINAVK